MSSFLVPTTVLVPSSTVIGLSVSSRNVKQGTPSTEVSSWSPPESVRHTLAFITKERNSIVIEGFAFATLGHNLQGNVISHDYLGTDQVINDLKKFTDYDTGLINLTPNMFKRNELGNIVEISSS